MSSGRLDFCSTTRSVTVACLAASDSDTDTASSAPAAGAGSGVTELPRSV